MNLKYYHQTPLILSSNILLVFLLISSLRASELTELRDKQFNELNSILAIHNEDKTALKKRFLDELRRSRKAATKLGSLERIEALDSEIFSYVFSQTVPAEDTSDGEIARVRDCYTAHLEQLELERSEAVVEWLESCKSKLDELAQKSIFEGRIAIAKDVEADKVKIGNTKIALLAQEMVRHSQK